MSEPIVTKMLQYFHTLKYLRPIQWYGQVSFRLHKPSIRNKAFLFERTLTTKFVAPIRKHAQLLNSTHVFILNQEVNISAPTIWFDPQYDKLWLYNLHYFDFLEYGLKQANWEMHLIARWIKENPPFVGCGFEPYTISLRVVNWIKWLLAGNPATTELLQSMAIQMRYLAKRLEIHLLGNHLLANAKALIFAGLFFTGVEADVWFQKGMKILRRELNEQILADGGHFELSPMYHSIILEDLADIINMLHAYGKTVPQEWLAIAPKMLWWLETMCHHDGDIAFFNDAAFGVAPTFYELKKYLERLNLPKLKEEQTALTHLFESGYCRLQTPNAVLIADIANVRADYQPGHAHADSLSFELSLGKQRVIINSGTSTYGESAERLRQRGTSAHNTLSVDDHNSSEVWKSFRVARRAKIHNVCIKEAKDKLFIQASHNGYYRYNKMVHTRVWSIVNNELFIHDQLTGKGSHKVEIAFHIHPSLKVELCDKKSVRFYLPSGEYVAMLGMDHPIQLVDSTYHPRFNVFIPNKKIVFSTCANLPLAVNTTIKWDQ